MGHLELDLLGIPQVSHDGVPLTFATRKTLALLVYLAVEEGHHTREKIATLFWPESDPRRSRNTLRRTLSYLRDSLSSEQHLLIEGIMVAFNRESDFSLDLQFVESAWQSARTGLNDNSNLQAKSEQWAGAIQRYRGDFLEGFFLADAPAFDEWSGWQRERWHQRLNLIFDRLTQTQSESGEAMVAMETAARWITHNPLNETAYYRLMRAQLAVGERSAALQTYELCRSRLAEELTIRPSAEIEAFAARIRREEHTLPFTTRNPSKYSTAHFSPPLIGREIDHHQLVTAFYTAANGRFQLVLLQGEAGIGKSRLAAEFLGWAAAQGADIVHGKAFETGGRLPYQPLVSALRNRIEQENAPEDLLSDTWLVELSRLLPELQERYPDLPPPKSEDAAARSRLFEAVTRLAHALAMRSPLVFFIDDIQWADTASLDLLYYASGRWTESDSPILLLLTLRNEAVSANPTFASALAGLEHNLPLVRLDLRPLTATETEQLVHSLAETAAGTELRLFSQWLFHETSGHPFYIMEILQILLERGLLPVKMRQDGIWQIDTTTGLPDEKLLQGDRIVPPGIQTIIQSRLKPLSGNSRSLLAAAAVLGHAFTFEQLCQIAHISEDDGLPALELLLNGRLLQESQELLQPAYFFNHDNIRHIVYSEISEVRRRIYHRRVAELLQEAGSSAANLAHHALAAGMTETAFQYSLNAGTEAMGLFAVKDAIAHFEQARQIIRTTPRFPPLETLPLEQLQQLYTQLGRAYELNDEFERAHVLYQGMLSLARELNDPPMIILALNHLATATAQGMDDIETAVLLLHEARELAIKYTYLVGQAETEWNLAHIRVHSGDPAASLPHAERALVLARQSGQQELVARCLNTLAYATTTSGKWAVGKVHAEEAQNIYQVLGNRALIVDNLCLVAKANINLGQSRPAIPVAQAALDMSLEIGNLWGQTNSSKHLGMALLECGRYGEALDILQRGVALARQNGYTPLLAFNLSVLGMLYRHLGTLEAAIETHHEVESLNKQLMSQPFTKTAAMELCADYALAEEWPTAVAYARQASAAKDNTLLHAGLCKWLEIDALMRAKEMALARSEVQQFSERYEQNERYQIPYYRCLDVFAEREENIAQAIAYLEQAVALARKLDLPGERWPILMKLAALQPDRLKAQSAKNQATEIINRLADQLEDNESKQGFLEFAFKEA